MKVLARFTFVVSVLWCATLAFAQTQVDFWITGGSTKVPYLEQVVREFNEAHPGINVVLRTFDTDAYKTALSVALASNDPPDVFHNWAGEDTGRLVREGHLYAIPAEQNAWLAELPKAAREAFVYKSGLYGVPYTQASKYFFYDEEIFDQYGIIPPETFDELLSICEELRAQGVTPISFGNAQRWPAVHYTTILNQKLVGEDQIEADYTLSSDAKELFTDPGYAESLQKFVDMQEAGCFNEAPNATSADIATALFYTGQAAMTYDGTWAVSAFNANDFEGQYGFFRMPDVTDGAGNQDYVILGPEALLVAEASPSKEAALEFIEYFTSQGEQREWFETGRLPVRPDAVGTSETAPVLSAIIENLAQAEGSTLWLDVILMESVTDVYLNVIQRVIGGQVTPEEGMQTVREAALAAKNQLRQ